MRQCDATACDVANLRKTHFAKVELFRKAIQCVAMQDRITMGNTRCLRQYRAEVLQGHLDQKLHHFLIRTKAP